MTEREWEQFFTLLDKILHLPGTWQDKRDEVISQALSNNTEGSLGEFANWFIE